MLTGMSLEIVFLTVWKLTIVVAVLVFVWLLAMKFWRVIRRLVRSIFRTLGSKRKVNRPTYEAPASFMGSSAMEEKGWSKV
jgi:hypothetical protein